MREILFRGKRVDTNEWVEGYYAISPTDSKSYIYAKDCHEMDIAEDGFHVAYRLIQVFPTTVGQYTGLTDKNGKKIFEGDIIKIVPYCDYSDDYSISNVYSYNGILCVDYHGDDFDFTALGFLVDYLPDGDFEVIGNIYNNLELLEV
jgi:uncharacterized phage protein (TIGR01671 family)